jgi:ATP-dependent DNA helicase DinG
MALTVPDILGVDGSIARRLSNFRFRAEQLEMSNAVAEALGRGQHLLVEAGTGVGKSFAYLVPAILAATADETGKAQFKRIVVSTHTISLQEQLITKDLPLLNSVIPRDFSVVLIKGRGNYLSLRRLGMARERSSHLLHSPEEIDQFRQVLAWAQSTNDGSLADLPFRPWSTVWDEVASDNANCLGRKCPTYEKCFYYAARRRAQHAQILVVNHALFFSDLALRQVGANIIPDYDAVILDEAHTVESVAGDHLGVRVTSGQVDYVLSRLYNDQTNKGLLVAEQLRDAQRQTDDCRYLAEELFQDLDGWLTQREGNNGRVRAAGIVENRLSPALVQLARAVKRDADQLEDDSKRQDLTAAATRVETLAGDIESWRRQELEEAAYWVERQTARRGRPRIVLAAAPIEVGAVLRQQLFNTTRSVILTSATLAVGGNSFDYIKARLGVTQAKTLQLGSPFNYPQQVTVVLLRDMPDPASDKQTFHRLSVEMIKRYVARTDGHAFVLFTSYEALRRTAADLAPWLAECNLALYSQAEADSRTRMLEAFRENPHGVLFGTDSFWQGVDVPGKALQNVIITKLPFSVPDQPLLQARVEAIRQRGGNPFAEYQLPQAVTKFRQGFGRLIRTHDDRGIVVVLDSRVRKKPYGRVFLDSLPDCRIVEESVTSEHAVEIHRPR